MKLKEIKELDTNKLNEHLVKTREKMRELRFGLGNRQVKNVREVRMLRREISRMLTVLAQKKKSPQEEKTHKEKNV